MKNIILFGSALLFLIWLLFFGLPYNIMIEYPILIAVVGCIVMCVVSVAFVAAIFSYSRRNDPKAESKDWEGYLIFAVILVSLFGSGIGLIWKSTSLESNEFSENGTFTTGIVVNGRSLKTRKADFSSLTVKYQVDGSEYVESCDMPSSVVQNYGIGQEVPIAYSKRNPKIFRVLNSSQDISTYTKKQDRNLQISDLSRVLLMKTADEATDYLNSVNERWTAEPGDVEKSVVYKNNIKESFIQVVGEEQLIYATKQQFIALGNSEISKLGFRIMENSSLEGKSYENNEYILNIKTKRQDFDPAGNAPDSFEPITIVTLIKK